MSNDDSGVVAVVCNGQCVPQSAIDLKDLAKQLRSDGLVDRVVVLASPCTSAALPTGPAHRAVLAGCPHLRDAGWYDRAAGAMGLKPGEYLAVDAKSGVFDLHPTDSSEALRSMLNASAQILLRSEPYEEAVVQPEARVLVWGSGFSGLHAALAASSTGAAVDVVDTSGPDLTPGCLSAGMANPTLVADLRTRIAAGAEAVFLPSEGASLAAAHQEGYELRAPEAKVRTYGAVVFAPEREEQASAHVGALTLTQLYQRMSGPEPLKGSTVFILDQEESTPAEVFEDVLRAAQEIRRRFAGEVHILLRHARVSETGLEELYDACREAGIVFTRIGPDLEVSSVFGDFTLGGIDLTTGARFEIVEPDRVVIPGPTVLSPESQRVAEQLRLRIEGLAYSQADSLRQLSCATNLPGVFAAGAARANFTAEMVEGDGDGLINDLAEWLSPQRALQHIPEVDAERCVYCLTCIRVCPFTAMRTDPEARVARVVASACRGCGACAAECPAEAISIRNLDNDTMRSALRAAVQGG